MKKNNKGFTIIELIVVIAIITILASIVMISVTRYIKKSKEAAVKAEMQAFISMGMGYMISETAGMYGKCVQSNGEITGDNFFRNIQISMEKRGFRFDCYETDISIWGSNCYVFTDYYNPMNKWYGIAYNINDENDAYCGDSSGNIYQGSRSSFESSGKAKCACQ